jgi:hypothetical protein
MRGSLPSFGLSIKGIATNIRIAKKKKIKSLMAGLLGKEQRQRN